MSTHNVMKSNQQIYVEPHIEKFRIEDFNKMVRPSSQSVFPQNAPKNSTSNRSTSNKSTSNKSTSTQSKPTQSKPTQSKPTQSKPTQSKPSIKDRQKDIPNPIFKNNMVKISDMEKTYSDLKKIRRVLEIERTFNSKTNEILSNQNNLLSGIVKNYSELNTKLVKSVNRLEQNVKKDKCCSKMELDDMKTHIELMQVNLFINLMQLRKTHQTLLDVQKENNKLKQDMVLKENSKLSYVLNKLKRID